METDSRIPVLFDTDIGTNIDDAIALAYLLCQPRCELLGITTVTGEAQVRAQLADAICRALGREDVPITSGAASPLETPQSQLQAPQKAILATYPHSEYFAPDSAVDLLRQTVRSRPGEITLLSVGPLTNIALLFALDPEIPALIKRHVMMGGLYGEPVAGYDINETNTALDPHAAEMVFTAGAPGTRCVGLDVTTRCRLPAQEFQARFNRGNLKIVGDMAEIWLGDRPHVTFHDPLAAACLFEPDLCTYTPGTVEIALHSPRLVKFRAGSGTDPHQVAVSVDVEAFFGHLFDILAGAT
jgi:purine nucleosidase